MRIIYLLFGFTLLLSFIPSVETAHAVPKTVKAKSEYLLAEKLLNQVNYSGAIEHAQKAKSLLGKSNSRIEYLLTKAYNAQGKYGKALASLEEFFTVTPESSSGSDEYNEMVALYTEVEILWQKQSKQLEAIKEDEEIRKKEDEAIIEAVFSALSQQMVAVPGGCFKMGSNTLFSGRDDEKPFHQVCLDGFSIGKFEVTQKLWAAVMGDNPSNFPGDENPVEMVSWEDAQQFLHKLNRATDKHYRLPTEAEWEYAARSGGKKEKFSGGNNVDQVGWTHKNSGDTTHPVGQKNANGLGLFDMSGNVWEWCQDRYGKEYYQNSPVNSPIGPSSGEFRVVRGGSWFHNINGQRTARRGADRPGVRSKALGFRLAHP